jgi:hypothetical protein
LISDYWHSCFIFTSEKKTNFWQTEKCAVHRLLIRLSCVSRSSFSNLPYAIISSFLRKRIRRVGRVSKFSLVSTNDSCDAKNKLKQLINLEVDFCKSLTIIIYMCI